MSAFWFVNLFPFFVKTRAHASSRSPPLLAVLRAHDFTVEASFGWLGDLGNGFWMTAAEVMSRRAGGSFSKVSIEISCRLPRGTFTVPRRDLARARAENTWLHRVFPVGNRILRGSPTYHIVKLREVRNASRGNSAKSEKSCIAMRGERIFVAQNATRNRRCVDDVSHNERRKDGR